VACEKEANKFCVSEIGCCTLQFTLVARQVRWVLKMDFVGEKVKQDKPENQLKN
jgi:hypothetical protein